MAGNGNPSLASVQSGAPRKDVALLIGIHLDLIRVVARVGEKLVYLLQRGHEFKIGHTRNLKQRVAMLSTGSAVNLKVVHTILTERNAELENLLKARFAANRLNREWFILNDSAIRLICSLTTWPTAHVDLSLPALKDLHTPRQTNALKQSEMIFDEMTEINPPEIPIIRDTPSDEVQRLFERHNLTQSDLTRALAHWTPPISRSYAHYVWHGVKPPSVNVVLAIHKAHPDIPVIELFQVLKDTRESE